MVRPLAPDDLALDREVTGGGLSCRQDRAHTQLCGQFDLERRRGDLRRRRDEGLLGDPGTGKETVEAFLLRWLDAIQGTRRESTLYRYRVLVRNPSLGTTSYSNYRPVNIPGTTDAVAPRSTFASVVTSAGFSSTLDTGDRPERLNVVRATGDFFTVLGVKPAIGRAFGRAEDTPQTNAVALLSYAFWQRRFNGDRGIVGKCWDATHLDMRGDGQDAIPELLLEAVHDR